MIQHLIAAITTYLQDNFNDVSVLTVASKTPSVTLPAIVIIPGPFTIVHSVKDISSEPRSKDVRQTIVKTNASKTMIYPLNHVAMTNTVKAALIKAGTTPKALVAGKDFVVNYQKSEITFPGDGVAVNDQVLVAYTCVQTTAIRQFDQEFFINIYANNLADAEKWMSLTCAVILGSLNELMDVFNHHEKAYTEKFFISTHQLVNIEWMGGAPLPEEMGKGYQLKFHALGELRMVRQLVEMPPLAKEAIPD